MDKYATDFDVLFEWITLVIEDHVPLHHHATFSELMHRYLKPYLNDQVDASRKTYQLLALGCLYGVSCIASPYAFRISLLGTICGHKYSSKRIRDSRQGFIYWFLKDTKFFQPGNVIKIVYQSEKSRICLTDSNVIIKTVSLMNAMIELITQSVLLTSSSSRRIQKWLGGLSNGLSKTVDLYYEYLPFPLEPSMMHPVHIVQQQIDDLMQGVRDFHDVGLAHRDLKFPNLRISADGHVTLIDFDSVGLGQRWTDITTTILTRAPEMLQRELDGIKDFIYDPKPLDMWSAGLLALELAYGSAVPLPEGNDDITATMMLNTFALNLPAMVSHPRVLYRLGQHRLDFVKKCLCYDSSQRPNIEHYFL
jgi:serine/threonine protein kinase